MSDEPSPKPDPDMDRRTSSDRRRGDRRTREAPVPEERREGADRRKGPRRGKRSINQYDLEAETLEFINAINTFKASSGRAFPTWSEVLGILKDLGYEKRE